jgi:hypothetical protein
MSFKKCWIWPTNITTRVPVRETPQNSALIGWCFVSETVFTARYDLHSYIRYYLDQGAQISGARSPLATVLRWRLIFVGPKYKTACHRSGA